MGGELLNVLRNSKGGKITEVHARFYVAQVILALDYMHGKSILYRDLKPENLLIAEDGYIKLVDMGLAKITHGEPAYTLCGTPEYTAPEVYAFLGHDEAADWWTLGVLIHELLAGYTPFEPGGSPLEIHREIQRYQAHYPNIRFPRHFSVGVSGLLKGLLHPNPAKRLGRAPGRTKKLKSNSWFGSGFQWQDIFYRRASAPWKPNIKDNYDTKHFRRKDTSFERTIDSDGEEEHEPWATEF